MKMLNRAFPEKDPRYQTNQIKQKLYEVINQARTTIECVNDMRAKVLLKTTADLITGLTSAYENYESNRQTHRPNVVRTAIHA